MKMTEIEKTEAEIKVLQKKLELLKEIKSHKSNAKMILENTGEFEVVSYNNNIYYRLGYEVGFVWMIREMNRQCDWLYSLDVIQDRETERLLEGIWFNDVCKGEIYD